MVVLILITDNTNNDNLEMKTINKGGNPFADYAPTDSQYSKAESQKLNNKSKMPLLQAGDCVYILYVCILYIYEDICLCVFMYVCLCACRYVFMYVCMYVYVYIYVNIYVYECRYVYVYICVCVCRYVCKYVCVHFATDLFMYSSYMQISIVNDGSDFNISYNILATIFIVSLVHICIHDAFI